MASSCGGRRSSSAGAAGARVSVLLLALLLQGCYSTRSWGQSVQLPMEEDKVGGPGAYYIVPDNPRYALPFNVLVLPHKTADTSDSFGWCTGLLVAPMRVLTGGTCCWDADTQEKYPAVTVEIGNHTPGAESHVVFAEDMVLPRIFEGVSRRIPPGKNTVERRTINMCILKLSEASSLAPLRIATSESGPIIDKTATTYGWSVGDSDTAELWGMQVSATSGAFLGLRDEEPEALTETWDTGTQWEAPKAICVLTGTASVGSFGKGDVGGPLMVVGVDGTVEVWGVLGGVYDDEVGRKKIAVYVNLRAPHWEEFFADAEVPLGRADK